MLGEYQGEHGREGAGHDKAADQAEAGDGGLVGAGVRSPGAGSEQQEVFHQCARDETEEAAGICKDPGAGGREENQSRPKDHQVVAVVDSGLLQSVAVNSGQLKSTKVLEKK